MTDRTDLAGRLDEAIGSAPEPFPPVRTTALLAAGRRARTRRRAALGATALGVGVLVVAGVALGAAGDDRAGTEPSVATDPGDPSAGVPNPSAEPQRPEPSTSPAGDVLLPGERVALTLDGSWSSGTGSRSSSASPTRSARRRRRTRSASRSATAPRRTGTCSAPDGRQGTGSELRRGAARLPHPARLARRPGRAADGAAHAGAGPVHRRRAPRPVGRRHAGPAAHGRPPRQRLRGARRTVPPWPRSRWRGGTWFVGRTTSPGLPTGVLPHRRVGVRPHPRRLPRRTPASGTPSTARACDEGRGRDAAYVEFVAGPAGPPAPDRVRRLRRLAPRRRPAADRAGQALRRLAAAPPATAARRPTCGGSWCAPTSTRAAGPGAASGPASRATSPRPAAGLAVEERSALFEALQRLPDHAAQGGAAAALARAVGGRDRRELGSATGTVKSHSSRGLHALEAALAEPPLPDRHA